MGQITAGIGLIVGLRVVAMALENGVHEVDAGPHDQEYYQEEYHAHYGDHHILIHAVVACCFQGFG